jgi:hypothetical protein
MVMHADREQASRNPNGSTGPRTPEAKERTKFNALKHGLTARNILLPGDDPEAFQERVDYHKEDLGTRNRLENELAERAAQASWMLDRALRSEMARLKANMLTEPAAAALRQAQEAEALGQRLLFDRRGPTELYPSREFEGKQPRTSAADEPIDPNHPKTLILGLEATLPGCQLLLRTWRGLGGLLRTGRGWQSPDKLKCIRLLGKQPLDAASDDDEVALIFLASHVIEPQHRYPFQELRCEVHEEQFNKQYKARLERRELEAITPAAATAARTVLLEIVDGAIERLQILEAKHQKVADELESLQADILSHDRDKPGEQFRRLWESCDRLHNRKIDAITKIRRNEAQGWYLVRHERERRKAERLAALEADPRVVVDEHGTVRNAVDYTGDLEEDLARSEAKFGKEGAAAIAACRPIGAEPDERAVPDFARWKPPTNDGGLPMGVGPQPVATGAEVAAEMAKEEGGDVKPGSDVATDFEGEIRSAELDGGVPVTVDGKGLQANLQNELPRVEDGGRRAEDGGPRKEDGGLKTGVIVDGAARRADRAEAERAGVGEEGAGITFHGAAGLAAERQEERSDTGRNEGRSRERCDETIAGLPVGHEDWRSVHPPPGVPIVGTGGE